MRLFALLLILVCGSFILAAQSDHFVISVNQSVVVTLVSGDEVTVVATKNGDRAKWSISDNSISISGEPHGNDTPELVVTLPNFDKLNVSSSSIVTTEGVFTSETFAINVDHSSIANLELDAIKVTTNVNHSSIVNLQGTAERLTINADHSSVANAKKMETLDISANANHSSVINLNGNGGTAKTNTDNNSVITRS